MSEKKCSKCNEVKDLMEFNKGGSAGGRHSICKECRKLMRNGIEPANAEIKKAYSKGFIDGRNYGHS